MTQAMGCMKHQIQMAAPAATVSTVRTDPMGLVLRSFTALLYSCRKPEVAQKVERLSEEQEAARSIRAQGTPR